MARVGDSAGASDKIIAKAKWYYDHEAKRLPKPFRECDPRIVAKALTLAGGVWVRLEVIDNRTIIVHNQSVWT